MEENIKNIEIDWLGLNEANVEIVLKSGTVLTGILDVKEKEEEE